MLALQVHAPLSEVQAGHSLFERLLLLFGCSSPNCGFSDGSWRAFRYQTPEHTGSGTDGAKRRTSEDDRMSLQNEATTQPVSSVQPAQSDPFSSWGGSGSWGAASATQPASEAERDPFSFGDLDAALAEAISGAAAALVASHVATKPPPQQSGLAKAAPAATAQPPAAAIRVPAGPLLPEFHLSWVDEPASAPDAQRPEDARHIAALVERYRTENDMVSKTLGNRIIWDAWLQLKVLTLH